ncbi:transcription-repair coupling factor [Candidatus Peregrinibacteria bacterium]|jgi:transcription-repair coupling factor (superfamily II helicase)|nr:transcription-repair coupling factor [Candidatus Peregrinibacteria bacterium]
MEQIKGFSLLFSESHNKLLKEIFEPTGNLSVSGAGNFSSKAFIFCSLPRGGQKVIWLTTTGGQQENVHRSLVFWGGVKTDNLELLKQGDRQFNTDVTRLNDVHIMERISKLMGGEAYNLVVKYEDLFLKVPKKKDVESLTETVKINEELEPVEFFERLIMAGYEISDDEHLEKGTYIKKGEVIEIFPVNFDFPIRLNLGFDKVESIEMSDALGTYRGVKEETGKGSIQIRPASVERKGNILDFLGEKDLLVEDELEIFDEFFEQFNELIKNRKSKFRLFEIASFMEDEANHTHLHYLSVLKYQNVLDMMSDLKEKRLSGWKTVLFTKHLEELEEIFKDKELQYSLDLQRLNRDEYEGGEITLVGVPKEAVFPEAFQTPSEKVFVITDKEIIGLKETGQSRTVSTKAFSDFLTSLKPNDYIVHQDHGIGVFLGLEKKTIDEITREYLKIGYAENDKLYVPIDQADKVSKYIGGEDSRPKLTRLGSAEWQTVTSKVQKETEKIAKELLELYASRALAKGHGFKKDNDLQDKFEESFPYEETPGQIKAIVDVKHDMETAKPMDRLVCGDVGFGKTEVAMRAAFKCVQSGKQAVVITPITILADQHYKSFSKRMEPFHIRTELLSRFQTSKQQKEIIERSKKGEVDIIIGTHRILSEDVGFKDLGLVIIDEEQRFGVKQKEKFKELRSEVDMLTLTATPIPRTLNVSLNGLRDITTITTPPPGRLPVVTEVRRYSNGLIRETILREVQRNGQVYFLHNRVETIESMASKLRALVPEAKFLVTHGKLSPAELENRILNFKDKKYDVLVSSTIIENGIDLANANTLIVNNAEKFGLAQLYQLRGRVGRSKRQAYAYFLYHSERLKLDAKKRLRAIVEASELGAGFQIAMKDLEIRGAGDILGVNQHGTINVVGVSHFMRMLNKAVDDLKEGRKGDRVKDKDEEENVTIELPLTAYIPDNYILSSKEKISVYQRLSNADNKSYLDQLQNDIVEEYGRMPREVSNLFTVLYLKTLAKEAGIVNVKAENIHKKEKQEIVLQMGSKIKPENIVNMLNHNQYWRITGTRLRIKTAELGVDWVQGLEQSLKALKGSAKRK